MQTSTRACATCGTPFPRSGRRQYCSDACQQVAYRRRHQVDPTPAVPPAVPRRPITVYECGSCGARALGEQRCADCGTFMNRVDFGGLCPHCGEPVALDELNLTT